MKNAKVNREVRVKFLCSLTLSSSCVLVTNKKYPQTEDVLHKSQKESKTIAYIYIE